MKRLIQQTLVLAGILFLATSCLDIQESIYMRNDGSGKFAITVDLEGMQNLIRLAEQFSGEQTSEQDVMEEVDINFEDLRQKLEEQEGISQVKTIRENNNSLLGIAFEFEDVAALNRALKEINDSKEPKTDYFAFERGQLKRLNTLGIEEQVQRKMETDIDISIDGVMLSSLLEDMSYTTKYTFEKPVKETSNPASKITNEGRTVSLTYYFFNDKNGTNSLENNISF
ncbi:RNA recognition motif domain-containing protein [Nafulsella turpanensis]|uniref:RNA recognition motif domain-containing protein n=1 Tax=Nafulsella turpanensis TaxID=1265690 RepID=UPI0012679F5B|nr:RNA-binding protein [Nafulsella turpanensis]